MLTLNTREIKYDENTQTLAEAAGYRLAVMDLAGKTSSDISRLKEDILRSARAFKLRVRWIQRDDLAYVLSR
jgi:hypothetical protein